MSSNKAKPPRMPWRRSSSTAACARKATVPSARTPASSPPSSRSAMEVQFVAWDGGPATMHAAGDRAMRVFAGPGSTRTTSCVDPSCATPPSARKNTVDNTPCVVEVSLVKGATGRRHGRGQGRRLRGQVQVRHAQPQSTPSSTGCSRPSPPWAPAGALPACSASASAAPPRRPCCSPSSRSWTPSTCRSSRPAAGQNRHRAAPHRALRQGQRARHRRAGLGGLTTVLDVKILDYPTHAANLPVAMIPNCAATRHAHFVLDGSGPRRAHPPGRSTLAQAHLRRPHRPPRRPRRPSPAQTSRPGSPARSCC